METLRLRISHQEICEPKFKSSYDDLRTFYIRLIQKFVGDFDQLPNGNEWKSIVIYAEVEILKEFAAAIQQFYTVSPLRLLLL